MGIPSCSIGRSGRVSVSMAQGREERTKSPPPIFATVSLVKVERKRANSLSFPTACPPPLRFSPLRPAPPQQPRHTAPGQEARNLEESARE